MQTYEMHPDQQAVFADGEQALERIDRNDTFLDWLKVGKAATMWQELAMSESGADDLNAHLYRKAHTAIGKWLPYPRLVTLNKTELSHSIWMWERRDELEKWHRALPANQARHLNHPSTIWRKNPLGEYREKKLRKKTEAADKLDAAASRMNEASDRFEGIAAFNPGLDMSSPERIKESGEVLFDYYGAKDTEALLVAAAPRTNLLVFSPDSQPPQMRAKALYDWLPVNERQDFALAYAQLLAADTTARKPRPRKASRKPT